MQLILSLHILTVNSEMSNYSKSVEPESLKLVEMEGNSVELKWL